MSKNYKDTCAEFKRAFEIENKSLNFPRFNRVYFNQNEFGNGLRMAVETKISYSMRFSGRTSLRSPKSARKCRKV